MGSRDAIRLASTKTFRVCHFSVRRDHVAPLVEAEAREAVLSHTRPGPAPFSLDDASRMGS